MSFYSHRIVLSRIDHANRIKSHKPDQPYDLIFVDAQKSGYPEYLTTILEKSQPGSAGRLLKKGGLIIADNTLRSLDSALR